MAKSTKAGGGGCGPRQYDHSRTGRDNRKHEESSNGEETSKLQAEATGHRYKSTKASVLKTPQVQERILPRHPLAEDIQGWIADRRQVQREMNDSSQGFATESDAREMRPNNDEFVINGPAATTTAEHHLQCSCNTKDRKPQEGTGCLPFVDKQPGRAAVYQPQSGADPAKPPCNQKLIQLTI